MKMKEETNCQTQKDMKRLAGARSICLDAGQAFSKLPAESISLSISKSRLEWIQAGGCGRYFFSDPCFRCTFSFCRSAPLNLLTGVK